MYYVIHCIDHDDAIEKRLSHYAAHKAYLRNAKIDTVISGPLLADDKETMIGSMFVVEANDKDEVVAFNLADPFNKAGLWETVAIHAFNKRVDNRG